MQTGQMSDRVNIYTVGHSNIELEEFVGLLGGVQVVVDLRSIPFSKHTPQFGMQNIRARLRVAGIDYVLMLDERVGNVLGGQPRDDDCYENGKIVYERVMERSWYHEGISRLVELASRRNLAAMCSEEDPHKCHRHRLIAQTLLDRGVAVFHIRRDGSIQEAEREAVQFTFL